MGIDERAEPGVRWDDPVMPPNLYGATVKPPLTQSTILAGLRVFTPAAPAVLQKCWGEALGRVYSTSRGLSCICVRLGHPGLDMDNLNEVLFFFFSDRSAATLVRLSRPAHFLSGGVARAGELGRQLGCDLAAGLRAALQQMHRRPAGCGHQPGPSRFSGPRVFFVFRPRSLLSLGRVLPIFCMWGVLSLSSEQGSAGGVWARPAFCDCARLVGNGLPDDGHPAHQAAARIRAAGRHRLRIAPRGP